MDGQSVKTTERGGIRGFDAHKRVKGRKRYILVDTFGLLIACRVEPADISDRRAAALLLGGLGALFPNIRTVIADAGHQSRKLAARWLEATDRQTSPACVQDHRPHLDCRAQLRLAWPQSTLE
jgi:putative transposase